MDLATVIGIITGFGLVVAAMMLGGGLMWFINPAAALIVVGGTIGATFINYPLKDLFGVIKVARQAFFHKQTSLPVTVEMLIGMSRTARREGILALEKRAEDIEDPFFAKAVALMVDGIEPATLSKIMQTELDFIEERHRLGAEIFTTMGNFAPAMGMVGTLIGLVQMLMQMEDPSAIGPAMAVALITTFYGILLANLVFLPIAGKLRTRSAQEVLVKQLTISGILSVQAGDNPRILEQKLHSYIAPGERRPSN